MSDFPYSLMIGMAGEICFECDCIMPENARFPTFEAWSIYEKNILFNNINLETKLNWILYVFLYNKYIIQKANI